MNRTSRSSPTRQSVIGIDLGGSKTLCALFDARFRVLHEIKFDTAPEKGEKRFTQQLTKAVKSLGLIAQKKQVPLVAVGIGCAGFVNPKSGVLNLSPNVPFFKNYPMGKRLEEIAGVPVDMGNDVQTGLYGEHQLGAAVGCSHVIGIFLGTGIGGAVIIDGKLHRGASGTAGQIGSFLTQPMGPLAGSGRHGTLDQFVSKSAITGEALTLAAKQWAPYLYTKVGKDLSKVTATVLADAIAHGDSHIEELVRSRARLVGIALSDLVNFLGVEMVVLGGGFTEAMPHIIVSEVEVGLRKFLVPELKRIVKVKVAKLGAHAITTGAAKLAFDRHYAQSASPAPTRAHGK